MLPKPATPTCTVCIDAPSQSHFVRRSKYYSSTPKLYEVKNSQVDMDYKEGAAVQLTGNEHGITAVKATDKFMEHVKVVSQHSAAGPKIS